MAKKTLTIEITVDLDSDACKRWKYPNQFLDNEVGEIFDAIEESSWENNSRKYRSLYDTEDGTIAKVTVTDN